MTKEPVGESEKLFLELRNTGDKLFELVSRLCKEDDTTGSIDYSTDAHHKATHSLAMDFLIESLKEAPEEASND